MAMVQKTEKNQKPVLSADDLAMSQKQPEVSLA